ncbi:MAG: TlpA disulfide reductase family protein [Candidatus Palauibacterales bacterium]|nr:TlpA disulfide reductase family protein [Candidatus Palauibacterales bacterium]
MSEHPAGPCRREMPELARLHRELGPAGLQTVGIAISSGSSEEIRSFAEQRGVDYLLLRASREWARRHFRMLGMPTTLIVDADGRIRERLVGPQSAERLRRAVEPLLPG